MNQDSDWQTFVAMHTPSIYTTASALQRARQEMLEDAILPAVQAWSRRYYLEELWEGHPQPAQKRLYACAFSGVIRTLDPHHVHHALMLACFSWWVSVLDYYLDHDLVSFVGTQNWSLDQRMAYLQKQLMYISAPLIPSDPLCMLSTHTQPSSSLNPSFSGGIKHHATCLLRDALADLCLQLQHHIDEERCLFAYTNALGEFIRFMHGQYHDVSIALRYHAIRHQPDDLEIYLALLRDGVGLRALAAVSLACEAETTGMQDWNRWLPTLEVGSHVIRLVNDCGGFLREQAEEKPNSITIALATLGYPIDVRYTLDSTAVIHAMQMVRKRLRVEQRRFHLLTSQLLQEAPLTPFGYCIISAVTSITRLYQAGGDYEVLYNNDATREVSDID